MADGGHEWELSKENVQPLKTGREIDSLSAALQHSATDLARLQSCRQWVIDLDQWQIFWNCWFLALITLTTWNLSSLVFAIPTQLWHVIWVLKLFQKSYLIIRDRSELTNGALRKYWLKKWSWLVINPTSPNHFLFWLENHLCKLENRPSSQT